MDFINIYINKISFKISYYTYYLLQIAIMAQKRNIYVVREKRVLTTFLLQTRYV